MRLASAVTGLLLLGTCAAAASSYDDFNAGIALRNHEEYAASLTYLSRALAAPDLPEHLRTPALVARGLDYQTQHNLRAAGADLTAAIALSPKLVSGYIYRAGVEEDLKSYNAAIADYASAINLKPFMMQLYSWRAADYRDLGNYADAETDFALYSSLEDDDSGGWFQLGFVQWAQSHFDKALASFERARDTDKASAYAVLWREITQETLNKDDSTLRRDARKLDEDKWPGEVVKLFQGKAKPDDVTASAEKGNAKDLDGQRCEAEFYIAEWHLGQKDATDAEPLFSKAASACPDGFTEKTAASLELARLKAAGTP